MTREETAYLLGVIALGDNRQLSVELTKYWHELLHDLRIDDAVEAVNQHRRESTDYLQPGHIRRIVAANRRLRLAAANLVHDPDPDHTVTQDLASKAALEQAARDGRLGERPVRLALAAPATPAAVPELVAAKTAAARAARGPLHVRCEFCHAAPGTPCRVGRTAKAGFYHPLRLQAHTTGAATPNTAA